MFFHSRTNNVDGCPSAHRERRRGCGHRAIAMGTRAATASALATWTAAEAAAALHAGECSARSCSRRRPPRWDAPGSSTPSSAACSTAAADADASDERRDTSRGRDDARSTPDAGSILDGVPIAVKDNSAFAAPRPPRVPDAPRVRTAVGVDGDRPIASRGRRDRRQVQHGRVRDGFGQRQLRVGRVHQPLGREARSEPLKARTAALGPARSIDRRPPTGSAERRGQLGRKRVRRGVRRRDPRRGQRHRRQRATSRRPTAASSG